MEKEGKEREYIFLCNQKLNTYSINFLWKNS